jgi:hypothetical protein
MKTPEILCWVFFRSQGVKDHVDLLRALILCEVICLQCEDSKPTIEAIKETGAFKGAIYDLPKNLLTDEKLQEMIDFKF